MAFRHRAIVVPSATASKQLVSKNARSGHKRVGGRHDDGRYYRTLSWSYSVLMVVRTYTTLDRLLTLIEALYPDSPRIKFVVEPGSDFARGLARHIEGMGFEVLTWAEAKAIRFDVVLAAHATRALGELRGPVFVVPHGAGYNRLVAWSSGSDEFATGLVDSQLTMDDGRVYPSAIGVSHEEQVERLRVSAPEAADRAVVIGDPVFDRIVASRWRRDGFRERFGVLPGQKLVVITSTWGGYSTVGRDAELPMRLLAQLPMDQYRVLLIMHPNVWSIDSPGEIRTKLRDALASGLIVVPPHTPWEAGLIAADICLGDHSSLSIYAAAIGCRFLLAADGREELEPTSPLAQLCEKATRLDLGGDLRRQIEDHLASPRRLSARDIADSIFQQQEQSWARFRSVVRALAGRTALPEAPRMTPVGDPEPMSCCRITAWIVSTRVEHDADTGAIRVPIERWPRIARDSRDNPDDDLWQAADHAEVHWPFRSNSEVLLHSAPLTRVAGEQWVHEMLAPSGEGTAEGDLPPTEHPNAYVAAYRHADGCAVRWRGGGLRIDVDGDDLFAAANVLHRLWLDGYPLDRPGRVEYGYRPDEVKTFCFAPAPR
ncbi:MULTISPECIES: hypothetical protein [unclassified Amycolatopsis]|uniref:hypothetical protein n=1 Tax=unclassified Amycolatopsis TaxID=2618356 RepID=UPI0028766A04|nr:MULTISPECIES: hypothetical protein [unclassified Amycolatopsis]MDS0139241.1 hypothetical protein [Amycolatopsis sp. 505]MDS0144473.1 hypothetical protein [Amycolatopsis sp. CM201R]